VVLQVVAHRLVRRWKVVVGVVAVVARLRRVWGEPMMMAPAPLPMVVVVVVAAVVVWMMTMM
jgi:hypothetical protein